MHISEKWKFHSGMKKRMRSAKKKEVHLTVLVDSSLEDFQKVIEKIRTEVRKHNHRPENGAKVSYDIIYAGSPERRRINELAASLKKKNKEAIDCLVDQLEGILLRQISESPFDEQ